MTLSASIHDADIASSIALENIDASKTQLFARDDLPPYVERLRHEAPMHYCKASEYGLYGAITAFNDILAIDTHHNVVPSDHTNGSFALDVTTLNAVDGGIYLPNFLDMNPPRHDVHHMVVSPIVAPQNRLRFEATIHERTKRALNELPSMSPSTGSIEYRQSSPP